MSNELKPCPFCGGTPELRLYDSEYFVQCIQCFGSTSADHQTEAEATAAWNRRAQPAEADGDRIANGMVILDGMAFSREEILRQREHICEVMEQLLAVTAERDRQVAHLEQCAMEQRQERNMLAIERDMLHGQNEKLNAERDQLRAEVERLRPVARELAGFFSSDDPRHWELHDIADGGAMAEKEG